MHRYGFEVMRVHIQECPFRTQNMLTASTREIPIRYPTPRVTKKLAYVTLSANLQLSNISESFDLDPSHPTKNRKTRARKEEAKTWG